MNATMRTIVWGTLPAGAVAGGYLGGIVGVRVTIAFGADLCACRAVAPSVSRTRSASVLGFDGIV